MRLVDADVFAQVLRKWCQENDLPGAAQIALTECPEIDAVPVVRCKECRYSRKLVSEKLGYDCRYEEKDTGYQEYLNPVMSDFYCARGERMDKEAQDERND